MTPTTANGSETMSPPTDVNAAPKRRTEDGAPQPRAKRNRYISIACNECKRRKIKCNGQTPCQRCGNLSLECLYAPNCCNNFKESDEFKQMSAHISSLQEQVDQLFANLSALRSQVEVQSAGSIGTPFNPQGTYGRNADSWPRRARSARGATNNSTSSFRSYADRSPRLRLSESDVDRTLLHIASVARAPTHKIFQQASPLPRPHLQRV